MKQKQKYPEINPQYLQYLSTEELFLLGFLKGFNRKSNQILTEEGLESSM